MLHSGPRKESKCARGGYVFGCDVVENSFLRVTEPGGLGWKTIGALGTVALMSDVLTRVLNIPQRSAPKFKRIYCCAESITVGLRSPWGLGEGERLSDSGWSRTFASTTMSQPLEVPARSEERRVGKECRSRWGGYESENKET